MKKINKVEQGLKCCLTALACSPECPYYKDCTKQPLCQQLLADALELLEKLKCD